MRILMIAPTPFFADRGCHVRIYEEIKALQKIGYEIVLCTYGLGREATGVKTVRCLNFFWYKKLTAGPSYTKILLLPFLAYNCIKTSMSFKPDIIHAFLHEGAVIARFCKFFFPQKKYFFDTQGSLVGECLAHKFFKPGGIMHKIMIGMEKWISSWFFIITQSQNLNKQLQAMGVPREKIANVGDGVDTDIFKPLCFDENLASQIGIQKQWPRIIYVGLLEQYQGVDLMFGSFAIVAEKKPETQFIIIGYPNIEKYKKYCQELGIDKNVIFLGRINYNFLPKYLSLADVAVAPKISLTEGDGKIYNYMAMGLPTVAFNRSTSKEILGETGVFAKLNDSQDFAEKILYLLANKERAKILGQKARERAVAQLSWKAVGERINNVYLNNI